MKKKETGLFTRVQKTVYKYHNFKKQMCLKQFIGGLKVLIVFKHI